MSQAVRELSPSVLWNHFADLNEVPRPSKQEERVIAFMMDFGKKLGLPTERDETGNVIIKKPATKGLEDRPVLALQSHLDMVHQKNADTDFDFSAEGIKMVVEGDWVRAEGTTLGADNGIGVACIMSLLSSDDIPHPALEALFTVDEETGMTGAMGLEGGLLNAKFMLNLDTEDDNELCIGCAGGIDVMGSGSYEREPYDEDMAFFRLKLSGLTGGHSGMDIHLGRGNANKLMNRFLLAASAQLDLRLHTIDGGGLRNAIPRESVAVVAVPAADSESLKALVNEVAETYVDEYKTTDPSLSFVIESPSDKPDYLATTEFTDRFFRAIQSLPNGIYRMSPDVDGLVQTSSNLARISVAEGSFDVQCLVRGSVDSEKFDMGEAVRAALELTWADVVFEGAYPGWAPKPESDIVKVMTDLYREMFSEEPHVNACHAGLECGILGQNYPDMEMISFGPNIRGAHSPDERVQVSSVEKTWKLLLKTLQTI